MKSTLRTLAAALIPLLMGAGVAEAAPAEWKMHIVWVPTRPEAVSFKEFVAKANELSEGTLNITLYDSGSLGVKDVDMLRVLPSGATIQAAGLSPAYLSRDVPELPYVLPVGILPSPDDVLKTQPALDKIFRTIYDRHDIMMLGLVTSPVRTTHVWCKDPINSLEALKHKKLRVWGKFQVDAFAKLGVAAQIVPQNDLYLAMQTGVVDCAIYPIVFGKTVSLGEVAKNVAYLHPYSDPPLAVIVSAKSFKALPEKAQKALVEAGKWITQRTAEGLARGTVLDEEATVSAKAVGVSILADFPKADQDAYLKASQEVWLAGAKSVGEKGIANYEAVKATIK